MEIGIEMGNELGVEKTGIEKVEGERGRRIM